MANRQTRSLAHRSKGTRANRAIPASFSNKGGPTIIERPVFRGTACDTSFANAPGNGNKHRHAHSYKADQHMSQHIQYEMCGLRRKAS